MIIQLSHTDHVCCPDFLAIVPLVLAAFVEDFHQDGFHTETSLEIVGQQVSKRAILGNKRTFLCSMTIFAS